MIYYCLIETWEAGDHWTTDGTEFYPVHHINEESVVRLSPACMDMELFETFYMTSTELEHLNSAV